MATATTLGPDDYYQITDTDFMDYPLKEALLEQLATLGFRKPTYVQATVIDQLIPKPGQDAKTFVRPNIGAKSETGSGKTLAMLIPIGNTIDPSIKHPQAIIIEPTFELALQTFSVSKELLEPLWIQTKTVIRDVKEENIDEHIIVATPWKLKEFVKKGYIKLEYIRFVVVDEADCIFREPTGRNPKRGFMQSQANKDRDNVMAIIEQIKQVTNPTFLLFSATYPKQIKEWIGKMIDNIRWINVTVKDLDEADREDTEDKPEDEDPTSIPSTLKHVFVYASEELKQLALTLSKEKKEPPTKGLGPIIRDTEEQDIVRRKLLVDTLGSRVLTKCIIFMDNKERCKDLSEYLTRNGTLSDFTVGGLMLSSRERAAKFESFSKTDKTKCLVVTDVFERGIDIPAVSLIVAFTYHTRLNIDTVTQYIHRAGRTSRFGQNGICVSLVCRKDEVESLEYVASECKFSPKRLTIPEFIELSKHE